MKEPNNYDGKKKSVTEYIPSDKKSTLDSMSDTEIWASFKNGNESAFNYIYRNYFHELFSFGMRFTTNREIVKDGIQDLFIELRKVSQNLSATNNIRFYLYGALKKKIARLIKKESKVKLLDSFQDEGFFEVSVSHETKLVNQQISVETRKRLDAALSALTKREKEAMYYFYYQSMSYAEVAEIMGFKSPKQARNLIYKCLRILRSEVIISSFSILLLLYLLFHFCFQ